MSEREDKRPKFDPYTGEMIEENTEDGREEKESIEDRREEKENIEDRREEKENIERNRGDGEPTYEKFVWESVREEGQQGAYTNHDTVERFPIVQGDKTEKSNGLATACLVLGILSLLATVSCCFTVFSIPLAIASIICGALAEKPRDSRDKKRFIGFLMSIISIVVTVFMVIFLVIAMNTIDFYDIEDEFYHEFYDDGHDYYDDEYDDGYDYDDDIDDFFDRGQEIEEYPSDYGRMQEL